MVSGSGLLVTNHNPCGETNIHIFAGIALCSEEFSALGFQGFRISGIRGQSENTLACRYSRT